MLFKAIIGQTELKQKLIQTVKNGRISHAQLFVGNAGYGGVPLAIAYAQYISCKDRAEKDSCGKCSSCVKYEKLIHPDLHFVFPVNTTKNIGADKKPVSDHFISLWRELVINKKYFSEDQWYQTIGLTNKQGNISANESASILAKLNLKPYESNYKIMIIWLPERLNVTSANRLLKLIEEPPANTIFLLVTENEKQILQTIYSRTQRVNIPPIEELAIKNALKTNGKLSEKEVDNISKLARGNYVSALSQIETEESPYFQPFIDLMRKAYSNNIIELISWAEEISGSGRENQKSFLNYAQQMLRENFMLNRNLENITYLGLKENDWSVKFSEFITPKNISNLYTLFNDCIPHIIQNGNAKIIFTDLALKVKEQLRTK